MHISNQNDRVRRVKCDIQHSVDGKRGKLSFAGCPLSTVWHATLVMGNVKSYPLLDVLSLSLSIVLFTGGTFPSFSATCEFICFAPKLADFRVTNRQIYPSGSTHTSVSAPHLQRFVWQNQLRRTKVLPRSSSTIKTRGRRRPLQNIARKTLAKDLNKQNVEMATARTRVRLWNRPLTSGHKYLTQSRFAACQLRRSGKIPGAPYKVLLES